MTALTAIKEWRTVKLGDCLSSITNGVQDKQKKKNGHYKITRIETIGQEYLNLDRVQYADGISEDKVEKFRLRKNDILFSHINSDIHLGKTVLVDRDYEDVLHGMNLLRIKADESVVRSDYLQLLFKDLRSKSVFIKIASRAVNQSSINQSKLKSLEFTLPPISEQRVIAHTLGIVQDAITEQEKLIDKLNELKKSMMQHLFTHGIKVEKTKNTEIGEMPDSWKMVELGDVCEISTGTTPATKNKDYYVGITPFIKTTDILNNRIVAGRTFVSDDAMKRYNLKKYPVGTLFLAMYGQGKTRGQISILGIEASTSQNAAAIVPGERILPACLWQDLLGQYERLRISGADGHISHLNLGYMKKFKIPLPDRVEQEKIAHTLASITYRIESTQSKIDLYQNLFKTLLHELMSGERRIRNI